MAWIALKVGSRTCAVLIVAINGGSWEGRKKMDVFKGLSSAQGTTSVILRLGEL